MNQVVLTPSEMEMAIAVGTLRTKESMRLNLDRSKSYLQSQFEKDIQGAAAELAYCKFRGKFWPGGVGTYKDPDAGLVTQVRSTTLEDGSLIVRSNDDPNHIYVLVIGSLPKFRVAGWIKGQDARRSEYFRNPNGRDPAWFVPIRALNQFPAQKPKEAHAHAV
jgi:hypothetical protein